MPLQASLVTPEAKQASLHRCEGAGRTMQLYARSVRGFPRVASSQSSTADTSSRCGCMTRLSRRKSPCTIHGGPAAASAPGACAVSHAASCDISASRSLPVPGAVECRYCFVHVATWRAQKFCGLPKLERPRAAGSSEWIWASVSEWQRPVSEPLVRG